MATNQVASPSDPLRSLHPEDARLTSSAAPQTLDVGFPARILIEDAPTAFKPRRRHRMPVFTLSARDLSIESMKSVDEKMAESLKSDAAHLIEMGMHFFRKGLSYEAVTLYRKALTHAPDSALGHYLLGIALKSLKQGDEARCAWKTAIASHELGAEASWARERAALLLSRV